MQREANFSGILAETFVLIGDGIRGVALYVVVLGGLAAAGLALGFASDSQDIGVVGYGFTVDETTTLASLVFDIASLVITIVANYLLLAHFLEVRGRLPDRRLRVWAYLGLLILSGLGIMIGLVLLVVPGIFVLVRWSAASGFLIGGKRGLVEALSDSWQATSGHGWAIFLAGLVLFLAMAVLSGIFGGAALGLGALEAAAGPGVLAAAAFVNAFTTTVFMALGIAIYLLVDSGAEEVAEVFA